MAYRDLKADVLLLNGDRSQPFFVPIMKALVATLPRSRRIEIAGTGHLGPSDEGKPERVGAELVASSAPASAKMPERGAVRGEGVTSAGRLARLTWLSANTEKACRMPRFLAVYTMKPQDIARFRSLPKAEQDATDAVGLKQWSEWEAKNAASLPDRGGMVGKTVRVTRDGIAPAVNPFCGYIVVEAPTIEAAARLFENHPHFSVFPGDGVDIMPFLTDPAPPPSA